MIFNIYVFLIERYAKYIICKIINSSNKVD